MDAATFVRKRLKDRQVLLRDPDGVYLTPFGITPEQRQAAAEESAILKPYRLHALENTARLLTSLGVSWFISNGTLLGWYRTGRMIPHDTDIDTTILEEDMLTVWRNRYFLPSELKMNCTDPSDPTLSWFNDQDCSELNTREKGVKKLQVVHTEVPPEREGYGFCWTATVDLYTFHLEPDGLSYLFDDYPLDRRRFPKSYIFPLQKSQFEEIDVFVPHNPKGVLEIQYGYLGEDAMWDEATKLYKPTRNAS